MIKGIRSFHSPVTNVDRAVKFYAEALGMALDYQQPGWTAMKFQGLQIGLHPEKNIHFIPRDSHGAKAGGCLTLISNNIPEDRKLLESKGAKILGEENRLYGHMLVFEDPDGNVLKLMNPKY